MNDPRTETAQLAAPLVRYLSDVQRSRLPAALLFGVSYPLELVIGLREYRRNGKSSSDRRVPELIVSHSLLNQDSPNPFERTLRLRRAQEGSALTGAELQGYVDGIALYLRVYFDGPERLPDFGRLTATQRQLSSAFSGSVSRWAAQMGIGDTEFEDEPRFAANIVAWLTERADAQWHTVGVQTAFDTVFAHVGLLRAVESGQIR